MRDHRLGPDDATKTSKKAGAAPGKRTRTERFTGAPARGTDAHAASAPAAIAPVTDAGDDPYGLHTQLTPDEREEVFDALHEVIDALDSVGKKLEKGAKLTGILGKPLAEVSSKMKSAGKALRSIAEKLGIVVLVAELIDATVAWSDAFDAYQRGRSPEHAAQLTAATSRWCELAIDVARKLPEPAASVIINGLRGADVAVAVGVKAGTESLSSVRAEEAQYVDGPPPATAPAAPAGPAHVGASGAYRRAFHDAVDLAPHLFFNEAARDAFVGEVDGLIEQWASIEKELGGLEAFWKIGPLADKARIADAHDRADEIKRQINLAVTQYNARDANLPIAE